MAENAKNDAAAAEAEKKGRAKKQKTEDISEAEVVKETPDTDEAEAEKPDVADEVNDASDTKTAVNEDNDKAKKGDTEGQTGEAEDEAKNEDVTKKSGKSKTKAAQTKEAKAKKNTSDERSDEDFQTSVREQIENCQFAIVAALQESIHKEINEMANRRIRQVERRRRISNFMHDIIIVILAAIVGYFGYCLYDVRYFDFMQPACEQEQNCEIEQDQQSISQDEKVVKDTAWYIQNYGNLFTDLQLELDADNVSAYYLYSGDYKLSEIQPTYLLGMAYNRLNLSPSYGDSNGNIIIPASDIKTAFVELFGSDDYYVRRNFVHGCTEFRYDRSADSFVAPSKQCSTDQARKIIENIDEIYEEGKALYILTTAAIYDTVESSFYSFDNLFKPVASNVTQDDFDKYRGALNKYQYQFKKVGEQYHFSSVVKLK